MKKIFNKFKYPKKMMYRKEDKENYEKSIHCYVCEGELGDDKVRDHYHFTGRYRGAAHNKCKLKIRTLNFIPVIFHNLEGYDSHLFIKTLELLRVILIVYQRRKESTYPSQKTLLILL